MVVSKRSSAKRYGIRYGARLRDKIGRLEKEKRDTNNCPYCHYRSVERLAAGIWLCTKCNSKFTGRAYYTGKKVEVSVVAAQEAVPAVAEPAQE
ncbi:hypothetical protein HYU12_00085 [Candidatus Woesearchaeota archaeon]|nr:hypothetical protein [Candidatus Woesearchaeota archaeon]